MDMDMDTARAMAQVDSRVYLQEKEPVFSNSKKNWHNAQKAWISMVHLISFIVSSLKCQHQCLHDELPILFNLSDAHPVPPKGKPHPPDPSKSMMWSKPASSSSRTTIFSFFLFFYNSKTQCHPFQNQDNCEMCQHLHRKSCVEILIRIQTVVSECQTCNPPPRSNFLDVAEA